MALSCISLFMRARRLLWPAGAKPTKLDIYLYRKIIGIIYILILFAEIMFVLNVQTSSLLSSSHEVREHFTIIGPFLLLASRGEFSEVPA